jgi:hypothetical protein
MAATSITPVLAPAETRRRLADGLKSGKFHQDQSVWIAWRHGSDIEHLAVTEARESCGTTACVAGWATILAAPLDAYVSESGLWRAGRYDRCPDFARMALDITLPCSAEIFYRMDDREATAAIAWLAGHPEAQDLPRDGGGYDYDAIGC